MEKRERNQINHPLNTTSLFVGSTWDVGFPDGASGKEPVCQCRSCKKHRFIPWVGKIPWRRAWRPTPVFSPGDSCGQRSLTDYRARHDWSNWPHMHLGCNQHWDVTSIMCWSSNKNLMKKFLIFCQQPMTSFNQVKQVWGHCSQPLNLIHGQSHENMATKENKGLHVCF